MHVITADINNLNQCKSSMSFNVVLNTYNITPFRIGMKLYGMATMFIKAYTNTSDSKNVHPVRSLKMMLSFVSLRNINYMNMPKTV